MNRQIPKKRKKRTKNLYFTKVHENAIVQYARCDDRAERTHLYIAYIQPALGEMVDKIVYTYKFTSLPNIDYLKNDCKIWLTTILDKYDPNRGSSSVITKNWFIHKVKKTTLQRRRETSYEDLFKDIESEKMVVQNEYEGARELSEFWKNFYCEMKSWDTGHLKENEKKVLEAVKILFESVDDIEIFNKKAIYLYLRELTGLNTKQVVNNLNKLRVRYRKFKKEWDKGKI